MLNIHETLQAAVAMGEKPTAHRHAHAAQDQKLVPDDERRQPHVRETGGHDLAEALVQRGLARAKGTVAILPDGTKAKDHMAKLKQVEAEARAKRVGIRANSKFGSK